MTTDKEMKLADLFPFPSYQEWRQAAEETLGGVSFEKKLITKTYENIDLQPIYSKENVEQLNYLIENLPGEYPYARSTEPIGYKNVDWEIAQEIAAPTPEIFNNMVLNDLNRGLDAIVLSIDEDFAATNIHGNDLSKLMISNFNDLKNAFDNVALNNVSLRVKANSLGLELAAMIIFYLNKQEKLHSQAKLCFGISPLNQLKVKGKSSIPISKLFDDAQQLINWKIENNSNAKIISINAEVFLNGGSSSTQDVAYSLAEATYIVRELLHRGLNINDIASSIAFEFSIGPKFFTEIAKFRAARMLWAKIIKEFGGNAESQKMTIFAATSKINKTKFDPNVNMLRATTEVLSAVLGGCQAISVGCYDEALGIPNDISRRIARNIQSVIMHEAHITDTIDPASGSWYLEVLTNEMAHKSWDIFKQVESMGGILNALKNGSVQDNIVKTANARLGNIASRRETLLGTNKYPNLKEKPVETLINIDVLAIKSFIQERQAACNNHKCQAAVNDYRKVFMSDRTKSIEKAIAAFSHCTSIKELIGSTDILDSDIIEARPIAEYRMGEIFENLRNGTISIAKDKGIEQTSICLVNFGQLKEFKARNDFSTDFFQVAGFEMVNTEGALSADEGIERIKNTNYNVYVACSTDDRYSEIVPDFATKFKAIKPDAKLILAGYPADYVESFKSDGIDEFIHIKTNIYEFLSNLMKEIGIIN